MPRIRWARRPLSPGSLLGAQIALVALVLTVEAIGFGSTATQARTSWLASVVCNVGTFAAARHVARRLRPGHPARRFWWAICAAAVLIGSGYAIQLVTAREPVTLMPGPVTAAMVGLGVAVVVVVMCTYPLRINSGQQRICLWLDMATVMVAAGAFGWYFSDATKGDLRTALIGIATGPVIMLVAVFAVAKLLLSGTPPFGRWTGLLGAFAATSGGLLSTIGPTLEATGHGSWLLALNTFGDAGIMIAAWLQRLQVYADPESLERPRRRPYSALPYVALSATFVLLTVTLVGRGLDGRTWAVLAGAGVSAGLVVVRQLASFADNARLLGALDAKVRELHETEAVLRAALEERDALAARLHDMAFQDSLTGLANRALFHDRLGAALARARRAGTQVVVMLLDLDDFKPINDRHGHAAGDAVLVEVAARMRGCLRETDTLARLGGDEFAAVLEDPLPGGVDTVAQRLVAAVREPFWFDGARLAVGVSVGVATDRGGEHQADELLRDADTAMYAAKSAGKGSYATR